MGSAIRPEWLTLVEEAFKRGLPIEAHVAGRGTEDDAAAFVARGITPHLNLTEHDKAEYLRSLDLFISMSLWEGFNLPVVEAQTLGTLSLALDVGAHPEVCPFLLKNPSEAIWYLTRATQDPSWLVQSSTVAATFARERLSWENTSARVKNLLCQPPRPLPKRRKGISLRRIKTIIVPQLRAAYRWTKRLTASVGR